MPGLLDILAGVGIGGSAAIDSRDGRLERQRVENERKARQQLDESRQRTAYEILQSMNPGGDRPAPVVAGTGPDPDSAAIGIQPETPDQPAGVTARLAAFEPNHDYVGEYQLRRTAAGDEAEANDRELRRQTELGKTERAMADDAEKARQFDVNNRAAFADATRLQGADKVGEYDPTIDYSKAFTRASTILSGERSEAAGRRADAAASRAASAAERTAGNEATRLAAQSRRDAIAAAQLRARGTILKTQLERFPAADQQALQAAHAAVLADQDDLDDATVWGIVSQQYEAGLLPGQKVRIRSADAPPDGQVAVDDPAVQAEIEKMRRGGG